MIEFTKASMEVEASPPAIPIRATTMIDSRERGISREIRRT